MNQTPLLNNVSASNTRVFGRALVSSGQHHFVIDGSTEPKEEITPIDAFLAGIASCAVHLMERFGREASVRLEKIDVDMEAVRPEDDLSRFDHIDLRFDLVGPDYAEAEDLVERFKGR